MSDAPDTSFDSHADVYDEDCTRGLVLSGENKEFFARGRLARLERVRAAHSLPVPRRVVDFGCGVGDVTKLLADLYPEADVVGVDSSSRCIDRARARFGTSRATFATIEAQDRRLDGT